MTIIEIMEKYNLGMKELATKLNIPYRTVQDWKYGNRKAPDYVLDLIDRCLEYEREK